MGQDKKDALQGWTDSVDAELYEELLNRYERILVFAGQLQEKLEGQKLLEKKSGELDDENQRLRQMVALSDSYIRLLENSLRALGISFPETK